MAPRSFSPISSLQTEMNRMLEDFFNRPFGWPLPRDDGQSAFVVPALDVKEDEQNIFVTAELPGVKRDDGRDC